MRLSTWGGALALLLLASCKSNAVGDLGDCGTATDPAKQLRACTALIGQGGNSDATRARAYVNRSVAQQRLGQPEAALSDMDEAVKLQPQDATMLAARGGLLADQDRMDAAKHDVDRALEIDPDNLPALQNRAVLLESRGQMVESRVVSRKILELDPNSYAGRVQLCWTGAVIGDDLQAALGDCQQALAQVPNDANNYNNLGFVYFRLGKLDMAEDTYSRAIEGKPGEASSWLMRGLARRALGMDGADADIAKAAALDPGVAARYAAYGIKTN